MLTQIGIWLDHSIAHLVKINNKNITLAHIESGAESKHRLSGGSRSKNPFGPQDVGVESKAEDRRKQQLHRYYQDIIKSIKHIEKVFICGPAEAKIELEKEIRKCKDFSAQIVAVQAAEKMTENQLVAKVKSVFQLK